MSGWHTNDATVTVPEVRAMDFIWRTRGFDLTHILISGGELGCQNEHPRVSVGEYMCHIDTHRGFSRITIGYNQITTGFQITPWGVIPMVYPGNICSVIFAQVLCCRYQQCLQLKLVTVAVHPTCLEILAYEETKPMTTLWKTLFISCWCLFTMSNINILVC